MFSWKLCPGINIVGECSSIQMDAVDYSETSKHLPFHLNQDTVIFEIMPVLSRTADR